MNIRLANEFDVFNISKLWLGMVNELDKTLEPNVDWWRQHATMFLKSGDYFCYVAEVDNEIIGFIDFFMFAEPATNKFHCIGQHFYVLSKYRKTNTAGRLYKAVLKLSKKLGAQCWELFCFENELPMWQKHGYQLRRCLVRK